METSGFCTGACGNRRKLPTADPKDLHHYTDGAQVAAAPLWSGMVTSQVSTGWSALSPSLKSTVVAGEASAAKSVLR